MGLYLNLTGKLFLTSLAAYAGGKVVEALTADDHRSVEEQMTPEWKAAVERARVGGDMLRFAELLRRIVPRASDDDIRHYWSILTPGT